MENELPNESEKLINYSKFQEDLLKSHGGSDIGHNFLRALAIKCSFVLFDKEHMQELLTNINKNRSLGNEKMLKAGIGLLTVCFFIL